MANSQIGPNIYIDTASEQVTVGSTKVSYIFFTPSAIGDLITLSSSSGGTSILTVQSAVAEETKLLDVSFRPLVFPNGIYISALSSGAVATIVTTRGSEI